VGDGVFAGRVIVREGTRKNTKLSAEGLWLFLIFILQGANTNLLIGGDLKRLHAEVRRILAGEGKRGKCPPLWDGHASERIAEEIIQSNWSKIP
jgi:hypothetical protein